MKDHIVGVFCNQLRCLFPYHGTRDGSSTWFTNCGTVDIISGMKEKDKYFIEEQYSESYSWRFVIDELLFKGKTKYQNVHCFINKFFGKVLFLDEKIQSAQLDEFIYHEALVQPVLLTHPDPVDVLVIGGGEGATIREVLRHSSVKRVTMVDIDEELVAICQKYMPEWSDGAFKDSRTELIFMDARELLENAERLYDVIISDLTEPLEEGPSVFLFTKEFYERINQHLKENGMFVLQAGSVDPFYYHFFTSCARTLETIFPVVRPYSTYVVSFGLPWGFVMASKKEDPLAAGESQILDRMNNRGVQRLRYYHPGLHRSLFSLPLYIEESLKRARMLTDDKPFIWEI